ncbi:MAG: phage head morphogenesis protein [Treponema sp.]|jgi:SPP1 gp7 family putative phage head morphogenesis protein|nr:phage head morphogenesis protein [Treponema sp.]
MADLIPEPVEAKRYLSRKAVVETERWNDLKHGEHAHAFTVAHSRNANVLDDIFKLLNTAMAEGKSFNDFKKEMHDLMRKKKWYGRDDKGPDDEEYINWRTRLIYHVNMRTAYEAGRFRQQLRGAKLRPIWQYTSKLAGKHRREDHIALHGKAFRFDDPFWNENRPPNGWGCECSVVTLSEAGAAREGVEILSTDAFGNLPALVDRNGNAVDWKKFTPETWRYNPGLEALAPNFSKYENLKGRQTTDGRNAYDRVVERYNNDMDGTRLTASEFDALIRRINRNDYLPVGINYQVGNLDQQRHQAMRNAGVVDSKIMSTDGKLYHGIEIKNKRVARRKKQQITSPDQRVPADQQKLLYQTLQSPDRIFEEVKGKRPNQGRIFHFITDTHDGKVIKVLLEQKNPDTALQVTTISKVEDQYGRRPDDYKEIR